VFCFLFLYHLPSLTWTILSTVCLTNFSVCNSWFILCSHYLTVISYKAMLLRTVHIVCCWTLGGFKAVLMTVTNPDPGVWSSRRVHNAGLHQIRICCWLLISVSFKKLLEGVSCTSLAASRASEQLIVYYTHVATAMSLWRELLACLPVCWFQLWTRNASWV